MVIALLVTPVMAGRYALLSGTETNRCSSA